MAASEQKALETAGDGNGGSPAVPPMQPTKSAPVDPAYRLTSAEAATVAPHRRAHPKPLVIVRAVVLLTLLGAGGWWLWNSGWTPPWVETVEVLTASGTLEADEVLVAFEVAGRIVELAQEGQQVQADEVVARLDDALIQVQIRQANVAQLQQLQIQADRFQLRSPIAGVVTRVSMHRGEVVSPGITVLTVADLNTLDLTAYVLERDLGAVLVGQEVAVTADPFPGRNFRGLVTSTNPRAEFTPRNVQTTADRLNLVFGVNIRVENPDGALKPGMPADVTFPTLPAAPAP